jgi:hypothetical protein
MHLGSRYCLFERRLTPRPEAFRDALLRHSFGMAGGFGAAGRFGTAGGFGMAGGFGRCGVITL